MAGGVTKGGKLRGQNEVLRNLSREIALIDGDLYDGILAAVTHVEAEAVDRAPIEFGVLRGSSFADASRGRRRIRGRVGFTAKYAPYVHEMPMKNRGKPRKGKRKGSYWQDGQNKFLERALRANTGVIIRILKARAKR